MRRPAIERLLPAVYQRAAGPGGVLAALLDMMETMHAPSEARLAAVDDLFAPYRTPEQLVPFLVGWVAFDHLSPRARAEVPARLPIPVGRMRDLVAESARLAQLRGTRAGLRAVIEIVTGVPGVSVEEPPDRPFHVVVRIPASAAVRLGLVRWVADLEKPAATTCEIVVDGGAGQGAAGSAREAAAGGDRAAEGGP